MFNSETEFSIEDVQATLETENNRERVEVPAGEYVCEIKAPLPDVRQDAKGHNKLLMPIEITGNPEYDGQWIFEAVYMNNQHDADGKVKDGIGKRKVARYAHACGLKSLTNLGELEGKHIKVDYGPNKRGYNEVREVSAFNQKPATSEKIETLTPPPAKEKVADDLPF